MMKAALLILLVCGLATAVPTDEEVTLGIPGYTNHKWYSGTYYTTQDISTSPMETTTALSTTSSSTPSTTQIMTPWCSG